MGSRYRQRYYQEWHFEREQGVVNTDQEWWVDIPKPIQAPRPGLYWAIEIHQIEYKIDPSYVGITEAVLYRTQHVSLSTSPRTGKLPFITGPADPDNIWFLHRHLHSPLLSLLSATDIVEHTRRKDLARYTDDKGYGKLLIGDHLYVQLSTASCASVTKLQFAIEFTWTQVGCQELLGVYQGRLNEA